MSLRPAPDDRRHPRPARRLGRSTARRPGHRPSRPAATTKLIYDIERLRRAHASTSILECARRRRVPDRRRAVDRAARATPTTRSSGLNALLDVDGVLGARLDDLDADAGDGTSHDRRARRLLDVLRTGEPPPALVTGRRVRRHPSDAEVVIAIDGVVVGGSELSTDSDGRTAASPCCSRRACSTSENEVRVALVVDGEVASRLDGGGGRASGCRDSAAAVGRDATDRLAPRGHRDPAQDRDGPRGGLAAATGRA